MGRSLKPLEIGVMFWAGRDPAATLSELMGLGVQCGQLGIPGNLDLGCAGQWRDALAAAEFPVYTVFAAFDGEDYADVPTVQRTVGFIPAGTRAERERRMREVIGFAKIIDAPGVATHIGFVPEDAAHPDYTAVRDLVRRLCDAAATHGLTFALETGQEPADVLLRFLRDVDRPNLGINFDPANMILYGTGDPIEALKKLAGAVISVHCKDGDWPPKDRPDALGEERALGEGSVGLERFIAALREVGYHGPLAIEREASNLERRIHDIRSAVELLRRLIPASIQ
jgi:sugar phosphate isomerase/epimerase